MSAVLKKLLGDAGAGVDESYEGNNRLYHVLEQMVTQLNDATAQLNQLRTDYNAETAADHTDTTATAVTSLVSIE